MNARQIRSRVAELFPRRGAPTGTRVGLEHELLTRDAYDGSAVPTARIRQATCHATYAGALGFEPGGQVELSLPCAASPAASCADLRRELAQLRDDCLRAGVRLDAAPVDSRPLREVPLQLTSLRYVAMQEHFDRIGPAGRRMMRLTASTQVCLDWWPGRAGLEQWRVLHLAAPFLAAAFARSSGPGSRLATWLAVDPGRTAYDDRLLRGDPVEAYVRFALAARRFTTAAEHLSTLFPAVRPRRTYLEVRFLDVQDEDDVDVAVVTLAALLYDDDVRRRVLRMLEPELPRLGAHWRAAADGDPGVLTCGRTLVRLAAPRRVLTGGAA